MSELNNPIIVTGATGWIGLNILHKLQQIIPKESFNEKVLCFGSRGRTIHSTGYRNKDQIQVNIFPLENIFDIVQGIKKAYFIHTAFITFDKISKYGLISYKNINKEISNKVKKAICSIDESRVVEFSSGAADFTNQKYYEKTDKNKLIYGKLKEEEEQMIKENSKEYLILRIYSLTGKFINHPYNYAFSQFILNAINKKRIKIKSKNSIIRGYGYAEDLSDLAIKWLFSNMPTIKPTISTISVETNLLDLAILISKIYNLQPPLNEIDFNLPCQSYTNNTFDYLNLLKKLELNPTSLRSQIKETYTWLKSCKDKDL